MAEENPFNALFDRPASTDTVPLAVLQPGAPSDAIKVSLRNCNLDETPYECIGYDRTFTTEDVSIEVDGHSYSIPQPLKEALHALRPQDKERHLWVDVLIGTTAEERSRSASATKWMLEHGTRTIAWLGPANLSDTSVLEIMQILAHRWQQAALHADMPPNWTQSRPDQILSAREKLLSFPLEPLQIENVDLWKTIEGIFTAGTLKSVQCIPELVLSEKPVIMVGDNTIEWKDFVDASRAYPMVRALKGEGMSDDFMSAFHLINSHEVAIWRYRNDDGLELLPMIQSSRDCSSNDPREFVFSMLPITRPSKRTQTTNAPKPEQLTVDYTKSVQEVFKEAAKYIIEERQDLLLWWSERPPSGRRINGLPSWVPDWSVPIQKHQWLVSPKNRLRQWSDSVSSPKVIRVDNEFALHVQAHALDRIESVTAIFTEENCRGLVFSEWNRLPSIPDETPKAKADRFWRTLIMDYAGMGESGRDSHAKPSAAVGSSWWSMIAEEKILSLLNCTMQELAASPELQARARSDPATAALGPLTGKSSAFELALNKEALGRRFFTTVSGRTGMTAIEKRHGEEADQETPPLPTFDDAMGSSLAQHMIEQFQRHVQQENPQAAQMLANALRGELPGQAPPGVRANDLVVVCVLGFQPYVLRPENAHAVNQNVAGNLEAESKYVYVGSCYMHGVMEAECFTTRNWLGLQRFRTDVELVDITIV